MNPNYASFANRRSINSFSSSVHFNHDSILCLFCSCSRRIIYNQWNISSSLCSRTCFQKPCICHCRFTSTFLEILGPSLVVPSGSLIDQWCLVITCLLVQQIKVGADGQGKVSSRSNFVELCLHLELSFLEVPLTPGNLNSKVSRNQIFDDSNFDEPIFRNIALLFGDSKFSDT